MVSWGNYFLLRWQNFFLGIFPGSFFVAFATDISEATKRPYSFY